VPDVTTSASNASLGPPRPNTPAVPLSALLARVGDHEFIGGVGEPSAQLVSGITHDSRQVHAGDLYCALTGQHAHGADFLAQVLATGPAALLTDPAGRERCIATGLPTIVVPDVRAVMGDVAAEVYGEPSSQMTMLGITGTNGKTTTAYMVADILQHAGRRVGLIGTVETRIGEDVLPSVRTTPEATDLHALLGVMRERGTDAVVMEVSSHALVMGRVDGVRFDVVGFTNLSQDHLDFHGDMEQYFAAKSSLFTPKRARRGIVCVDDAWGARLAADASIDITAVHSDDAPVIGMAGDFNRQNAAVASAMAGAVGVRSAVIAEALADGTTVPGRMERVSAAGPSQGATCLVDYAHTPEAIARVLAAVRADSPDAPLVVVLGAGGDRDPGKRAAMGAAAAQAEVVIVTDDNPRSEDSSTIRARVIDGARAASTTAMIEEVADRALAIGRGVDLARERHGILLILGKGHEQGQEIAGVVHPFDDRAVARQALSRKQGTA
jgi:UDP-N-acetylmuramoyl-L-alanyl-D-glutamate--2,6-diaminopimelate ligase